MLNINSRLIEEMKDKEYRDGYVAAHIALCLPNQIRSLRISRKKTQGELAELAGMAQPRISEMEKPGERKLNLETLQRIASAFDVGLEVRFVPFSQLIDDTEGFDPDAYSVKSFDEEVAEAERATRIADSVERFNMERVVGDNVTTISVSPLWKEYNQIVITTMPLLTPTPPAEEVSFETTSEDVAYA